MGLVVRIRTIRSLDVTYVQPEIILWGAAEITTGLICVCIPPLAALAHPGHHRRQKIYVNVSESRPAHDFRRTRSETLEEHHVFTSSDVELQCSGAAPGVSFPPSLVTTDISTGPDVHDQNAEKRKFGNVALEVGSEKAGEGSRAIGVTTTIRSEQYYL